jgi:dTDP-4-amino-4,6-dideoxygalactose transaminase
VRRRREIAARYHEALRGVPGLVLPAEPEGFRSSYHLYPVWIDEARLGKSRRTVFEAFRELGLGVQVHYIPVHFQPFYRKRHGNMYEGQLPEAERFYRGEISIPMFPQLEDQEIARVIECVRRVVSIG